MITINETLYKKMPEDIKLCFEQLPNPSPPLKIIIRK